MCANNGECIYDTACEDNFQCKCQPGFSGKKCQINIDECSNNPCLNGARCLQTEKPNDYKCECTPGFSGKNCQIERSLLKFNVCKLYGCENNSTCKVNLIEFS